MPIASFHQIAHSYLQAVIFHQKLTVCNVLFVFQLISLSFAPTVLVL